MYHSFTYTCGVCGDIRDLATNGDDGGSCHRCISGRYFKSGEAYDQEFIDQEKYERQQDEEYEARHFRR